MHPIAASVLSWLLLPAAFAGGVAVRRRAPRIPPPDGPARGQAGGGQPHLRILVIGDSSADGVGAATVEQTLAPQIAGFLHENTGRSVSWRRAGANSAIAAQIRDHVVPHVEERDFTHIFLLVGMNDMKNYLTAGSFKKGFGGLLYALHTRWPEAQIVWSPVIEMTSIPALPPFLAFILGLRRKLLDNTARNLCRERHVFVAPVLPVEGSDGFAEDGFHANAAGYEHWARHLATFIPGGREPPASSPRRE